MAVLEAALQSLSKLLSGCEEARRFRQAKARLQADGTASRALSSFLTECYARQRTAGLVDADWLRTQRQAACQHPVVREYLDAHDAVLQLLGGLMKQVHDGVLAAAHGG